MLFKKILCGLLASLMLTAAFTSCTPDEPVSEETSESETSVVDDGSLNLPADLKFEGQQVVFLSRDSKEWSSDDIYVEHTGVDTLSDAVFERNELVHDRLGVTIKQLLADDATVHTKVQQLVSSNGDDFQAVVAMSSNAAMMATSGYLRDLNSSTINYLDLTKEYWDQNMAEELSLDDHLYFATGDIMTIDNDATFCLLFNKTLAKDNRLPDLYQMVDNREWTMSKLFDYMDQVASDSSDADRTYGMIRTADTPFAHYYGGGVRTISKAKDTGDFEYVLDVGRAEDVATQGKNIFSNELSLDITAMDQSTGESVKELGEKYFGGGKALFYGDVMQCVERMRGFNVEFGVLPYPLYDENQSSYYHMMHITGNVISIPRSGKIQNATLDKVAATLEAMAYYSVDTLTEVYYEINLTSKWLDDPESKPMIELILNTRVYDLAYYFDLTQGNGNITHLLAGTMLPDAKDSVASLNRGYSQMLEKRIENLVNSLNIQSDKYGE